MEFTPAQETLIRTVFLEVDQEQTGVIIADQVVTIIKNLTGDFLYHQFKEAIGTDLEDVGELNYDKVKEIIGLYINQSKPNQWGRLCTRTEGPIGIDTLPYQIQKKAMQHGFSLNMMLVGSSGLGKSTMQNTLFKSHVSRTERHTSSMAIPQTVEICSATHSLEESGTQLKLTIIDTPGFGDHMNNSKAWYPVVEYINKQYATYLEHESDVRRMRHIADTRVHIVLYFIAPTGHGLKALDVEAMKALGECTNVVPVIAKADSLTEEEKVSFKARVMEEIQANQIRIFPFALDEDDDEGIEMMKTFQPKLPFALIGSDDYTDNRQVRRTKWGSIQVESPAFCDLTILRELLISRHLLDLVRVTDVFFYEKYRKAMVTA